METAEIQLTLYGPVVPYGVEVLVHIGSSNGLSLLWLQAITWANAYLVSIEPSRTIMKS